jgi:hypothetical protein
LANEPPPSVFFKESLILSNMDAENLVFAIIYFYSVVYC